MQTVMQWQTWKNDVEPQYPIHRQHFANWGTSKLLSTTSRCLIMPRREVVEGRNSATVFIGCSQSIASQLPQNPMQFCECRHHWLNHENAQASCLWHLKGHMCGNVFRRHNSHVPWKSSEQSPNKWTPNGTNGFHRSRLFRNSFWCAARVISWCKIFISIQPFYTSKPRSRDAFGLGPMGRNRGPICVTLEKVRACHYVSYRPSMPISLLYGMWRNAASHWFPPTTSEMWEWQVWRVWYATSRALKQLDQELCWDLIKPTNKPPQMVGHVGCLQVMLRRMACPTY